MRDNSETVSYESDVSISYFGFRLRCFKCMNPDLLFQAFVTYVRPLLEFSCRVWSPSFSTLENKIERVQRKFTKRLRGLSRLTYTEKLHSLGADYLKLRRLKLDLVIICPIAIVL